MGPGLSHTGEGTRGSRDGVRDDDTMQLVVFLLDGRRYALALPVVERIVRAVAVTPLPQAPPIVLGVIDVAGHIIPVLDVRQRLRLPQRPVGPDDQFAIVRAARRRVALVVDAAQGVAATPAYAVVRSADITPGLEYLRGVVQLQDGLVLIHDLDQFLSLDEAHTLDTALHRGSRT
jgi:purine-binding chemotaxis protein CheW